LMDRELTLLNVDDGKFNVVVPKRFFAAFEFKASTLTLARRLARAQPLRLTATFFFAVIV